MNNKIPCGGFYLSDTLGVDENGKLGVNGGEPYKSLVTDSDGNTQWEDRLAYDDSKLVVDSGKGFQYVKVADEVPSWVSMDAPTKVWLSNGTNTTTTLEYYTDLGNGGFVVGDVVAIVTTDNLKFNGIVFPKKGVYFEHSSGLYITGISSADSDTPEITWDGSFGEIKKLDEKFLPDQTVFYVDSNDNLTDAEGVKITLEQAKAVGLNFIIQIDSSIAKPISAFYGNGYASFYVAKNLTGDYKFSICYAGKRPIA